MEDLEACSSEAALNASNKKHNGQHVLNMSKQHRLKYDVSWRKIQSWAWRCAVHSCTSLTVCSPSVGSVCCPSWCEETIECWANLKEYFVEPESGSGIRLADSNQTIRSSCPSKSKRLVCAAYPICSPVVQSTISRAWQPRESVTVNNASQKTSHLVHPNSGTPSHIVSSRYRRLDFRGTPGISTTSCEISVHGFYSIGDGRMRYGAWNWIFKETSGL